MMADVGEWLRISNSSTAVRCAYGQSEGGMSQRRSGLVKWIVPGLALAILATAVGAGAVWYRARSRRLELVAARADMKEGRFGLARQHLVRLSDRWPDDGEILLLLGECEMERGRRAAASASESGPDAEAKLRHGQDAAIAAWDRVPRDSPSYPQAALRRATHSINTGKYAPAEQILIAALSHPSRTDRYELERALSRLYRFEGRLDDVRRVLARVLVSIADTRRRAPGALAARPFAHAGRGLARCSTGGGQ